jgi:hypothetical protein
MSQAGVHIGACQQTLGSADVALARISAGTDLIPREMIVVHVIPKKGAPMRIIPPDASNDQRHALILQV